MTHRLPLDCTTITFYATQGDLICLFACLPLHLYLLYGSGDYHLSVVNVVVTPVKLN